MKGKTSSNSQASAGMYTHVDGGHAQVAIGKFKIGRILPRTGEPYLTNSLQEDSWVGIWNGRKARGHGGLCRLPLKSSGPCLGGRGRVRPDALAVTVRRGRGSARDALSALDQLAASGSIDEVRPEVGSVVDALCDDDAAGALRAVALLHDAGWGPQQLAADLVEDLREAFLAAVGPAPDPLGGADVERPVELAGRLGLPRLVRSIEALGRAQVDMRDAPDPRVILEVALVRLARPDLSNSNDALLERMARLERLVLGEPGRPHTEPSTSRGPIRGASSEVPRGPVPEPGPTAGRIPTIGALRRNLAPAGRPEGGAAPGESGSVGLTAPPAAQPVGEGSQADTAGGDPRRPSSDAKPSAELGSPATTPPSQPARVAGAAPGAGPQLDRDTLVLVWGDQVVKALPAKAKALFGGGHFVSLTDGVATFALPSHPLRDRCEELRTVVEDAIAAAVGTRVAMRLVVEGRPRPTPAGRSDEGADRGRPASDGSVPFGHYGEDEDFDPDDPGEPVEIESVAQARLLEAFPGAQEVIE